MKRREKRHSLIVNSVEAEQQSRFTAIRLVSLTLRLMERWRRLVDDNDSAMIMMAVALINTENLTKRDLLEKGIADLREGARPNLLRRCNVSSVALATGINRETARRKVAQLTERGFLKRDTAGHVHLHPQLSIRADMVSTVHSQLETLAKAANELLHENIMTLGNSSD